jgi:hypothetical protein
MKITVRRFFSNSEATCSLVEVDSKFVCFGLEDEYREVKLKGETRIPAGTYKVTLRTSGGFHQKYSKKFSEFHEGMLWVRNVPNFEYILIHIGNFERDTEGCLLVGEQCVTSEEEIHILSSTKAYKKFYQMVVQAAKDGTLEIEYIDEDLI